MKVNKNTIIKTAFECGLKPIESTWNVKRTREYDRWHGSDTFTEYAMKFENGIELLGNKYSGDEPQFNLHIKTKQDMVNAELFVNEMTLRGYEVKIYIIKSYELYRELQRKIQELEFNEDIQKVLDFIKTLNDEVNQS
jgi:hypothetical protein